MSLIDARLQELAFLTKLELAGGALDYPIGSDVSERQMVARLLQEALLNDVGHYPLPHMGIEAVEEAERRRLWDIAHILNRSRPVPLSISHRGRVRRAELEEALRTGRDRDPTGLAFAKRYLERDLMIALLSASSDEPVSVATFDMNGLKAINDEAGSHAVGDAAIRAYLQVIVAHLHEGWDAYRGEGGDEVTVIMRVAPIAAATRRMRTVLQQLQRETIQVHGGVERRLSASCGVVTATTHSMDPATLLQRADSAQYRAKSRSRTPDRPATLVVEDGDAEVVSQTSPS